MAAGECPKNQPYPVAWFVDRIGGIFLSNWQITVFPVFKADLGSTNNFNSLKEK
jgi:hypothetical protein